MIGHKTRSRMTGGRNRTAIGIEKIASYIPEGRRSNYQRKAFFNIDDYFIENKLGIGKLSIKSDNENTSDLCVKAYENLLRKTPEKLPKVDVLSVITQNPDTNVPHTSAIVHGKLGFPETCACFDISIGCSGFVYGLNIIESFMKENGFRTGLLFTADPYSKIIDGNDRNTSLLFGDAATVTLLSTQPFFHSGATTFGTLGREYEGLICRNNRLMMNGRAVVDFIMKYVPDDIHTLLRKNGLRINEIDRFVFHQGSRYIVDMLAKRLKVDRDKVAFDIYEYGNTVSSSIPIILEKEMLTVDNKKILISGFGTGLSWSSAILLRD